jgi:hypothetical protein
MGAYTDTVHCQVYASRTTSSPRRTGTGTGTEREQEAIHRMRRKGKEEWKYLKSLEGWRLIKRKRDGNSRDLRMSEDGMMIKFSSPVLLQSSLHFLSSVKLSSAIPDHFLRLNSSTIFASVQNPHIESAAAFFHWVSSVWKRSPPRLQLHIPE